MLCVCSVGLSKLPLIEDLCQLQAFGDPVHYLDTSDIEGHSVANTICWGGHGSFSVWDSRLLIEHLFEIHVCLP